MGVLKNLGYIKKVQWYPCAQPDPVLWLEAAGYAGAITLLEAITFSCRDIVKMRAGISPWHARGMRALIQGVHLPDAADPSRQLLKFTIPIEKALFFFFVVDLTLDFLANWQSLIFKFGGCGPGTQQCDYQGDNPAWVTVGHDTFGTVAYNAVAPGFPCPPGPGFHLIVPAGWFWSASFSVTPRPIIASQPPTHVITRVVERLPQYFEYEPKVAEAPWFGNSITGIYMAAGQNKYSHGRQKIIEFQAAADTPCLAASGHMNATLSPYPFVDTRVQPMSCFG